MKRLIALAAALGTLIYIGVTHTAALVTLFRDLMDSDKKDQSERDSSGS